MPKKIRIRKATLDDVADVKQLVHSLRYYYLKGHDYSLPEWFKETLTYDAFVERFISDKFEHLVYEKSGNIHGYMAIEKPNNVYHLFVAEAVHSKGVGSHLWQYALDNVALGKQPVVTLNASLGAIPFYEKLGFVATLSVVEKEGITYQPMERRQKVSKKHAELIK